MTRNVERRKGRLHLSLHLSRDGLLEEKASRPGTSRAGSCSGPFQSTTVFPLEILGLGGSVMARQAHPWFRRSDGWWYVKINGKQQKLAQGRKNNQAALDRWHELMLERGQQSCRSRQPSNGRSVIDLYLDHAKRGYAPRVLRKAARAISNCLPRPTAFGLVQDCLPIHLTQWLDAKTAMGSDWTRSNVVKIVQRAFNWAAQQRLIKANPFFGVTQRPGEPRRPMTDEEFRALLRATVRRLPAGHETAEARRSDPRPGRGSGKCCSFFGTPGPGRAKWRR